MTKNEHNIPDLDFYKQIFNSVQQAVIVTDNNAKIILWNKFAEILYGYTSNEAIGKTTLELISPTEQLSNHKNTVNQINEGDFSTTEYCVKNKNGRVFPVKVNLSPIYNSENEIVAFVGISEDITEKKQQETELHNQLKFSSALNKIAEAIINIDKAEELLNKTNQIIGETLQLDRALIYKVSFEKNQIVGLCEWLKSNHKDIEATKDTYSLDLFKSPFTEILKTKKYLVSHYDNIDEPFTKDGSGKMLHENFKIKSLIWYPFAFEKNKYYVFTLNQILQKRIWTKQELDFIGSVTQQVNIALIKINFIKEKEQHSITLQNKNDELIKAKDKAEANETYYQALFENAPILFWEEDFSLIKKELDNLKTLGIDNIEEYLNENPQKVLEFAAKTKIENINNTVCKTLNYKTKHELLQNLPSLFTAKSVDDFKNALISLSKGNDLFETITEHRTSDGEIKHLFMKSFIPENGETDFSKVIVAMLDITDIVNYKKEIIKAKEETEASERKYRLIAENTSDGIFTSDETGKIIYVSPAYCQQLGYTEEEELNRTPEDIYQLIHPNDRDITFKKIYNAIEQKQPDLQYKFRVRHKQGHYLWREDHAKFSYDENGKLKYTNVICRDISENIKAERSIRRLKHAIESSKACIVITDTEGNIEYANPYFTKRTGYTPDEYLGKNPRLLKTELHSQSYYENLWKTIKSGKTWEGEFCNKDKFGNTYWEQVVISPIKNEQKQIINFVAIKTDISELKKVTKELVQAKEKAEESEYKVRSMFENTQIGILFCNTKGKILEANPAILDILGSPSLEASKKINLITFKPLQEIGFAQNVEKCMTEKKIITKDIVYTSKWGKTVFMKYYLVPVLVNEKVIGVWANLNNLTDLYKTQKELTRAKEKAEESDRLKSAFLRNISHEIRTPMNAIIGFSDMLLKPNITHEKQEKFSNIIHKSVNQLLSVVENTITIAHIETKQLNVKHIEFNPNKLILELFDDYSRYKNKIEKSHIKLNINISENNELIITNDYTRIKQVLNILLDNAFKFTDSGKIEFGYTLQDNKINFYVSDTGIGISKEKQEIIFKSFSQADDTIRQLFGGVGLGLSIAVGLIKLFGGELVINSEENKGTKIEFNLPIKQVNQTIIQNTEKQSNELTKITLLVAEDEEFNFIYIEELLSETDLKLIHAINGQEAVEIFKTENPDIILMDLKMPIMDGFEATREIRKYNKQVPIIAQTAFSYKRVDCINAGFTDYIAKPFNDEQLIKMITQYVDK